MKLRLVLLVAQWVSYAALSRNLEEVWGYSGIALNDPARWLLRRPSLP